MKNDDNECFLYCYIRKFKNVVVNNLSRISKKHLIIAEEIIDECNMDFENISLDELDKIENLLKVNIHIFGCNEKFNSKKIIRKSKLDNISEKDYDKTLEIYKKLNCKNIKEYLDIYLKLDICLQADIFNVFRNIIWEFEIDCSKCITSCSLSLDLMLKYAGVKIELIRDISIFEYVNSSILGGICIASQNIADIKMVLFHLVILLAYIHIL